jgi:HK97 gp10 family phage protein
MSESFNHFDKVSDELIKALGDVVSKTAFDIQALAASNAPVDTGFLKNSVYTVTSKSSNYDGSGGEKMLSETPVPDNDLTAYVGVGANYGIYLEYGTVHQPAQPYLTPAVESVFPAFEAAIEAIDDKTRGI